MNGSTRCLYDNSIKNFIDESEMEILGVLFNRYHGEALTTTQEAWKGEITILQKTLTQYRNSDGRIIFEYGFLGRNNGGRRSQLESTRARRGRKSARRLATQK